jgi:hypothetical protein
MAEKICEHCAMKIPKAANICPYCRKKQGTSFGMGCLLVLAIAFLLGAGISTYNKLSSPKDAVIPQGSIVTPNARAPAKTIILPNDLERKKILSVLKADKDEFNKTTSYVHPKTSLLGSKIFLQITESGRDYSLDFITTYQGGEWIFWDKIQVKVGKGIFAFVPMKEYIKRTNAQDQVFELCLVPVIRATAGSAKLEYPDTDLAFIYTALLKADTASIRLAGEHTFDRKIAKNELEQFKAVSQVFHSLFEPKK